VFKRVCIKSEHGNEGLTRNLYLHATITGARGGAVVEALRYKPEGRGIDFR
jgi:hypothetical protein